MFKVPWVWEAVSGLQPRLGYVRWGLKGTGMKSQVRQGLLSLHKMEVSKLWSIRSTAPSAFGFSSST